MLFGGFRDSLLRKKVFNVVRKKREFFFGAGEKVVGTMWLENFDNSRIDSFRPNFSSGF
jgi:hypothetical protein